MFKPHRIFLTLLVLLMCVTVSQAAAPRSNMPAGVQSFAPTGTVPENVSFRIVFRNPVVNRSQAGKMITPENRLFPFEVNPPLQLEGRWQNERTFTARLLAPLKGATTYTATLRDNLRDRRGNQIGPGSFRFQTEGLSPTDIQASMGKNGNAYFTLNFNMRIDPARLKGFMRIKNSEGRELAYNINGALPSRTIRVAVPVQKSSSRQRFTVTIAAGLKSGEGDMGIDRDITETVILDPLLMVQSLRPDENLIRAAFNFGIDPKTAKNFVVIEPSVSDVEFESGWDDEYFIMRSSEFKPRNRFVITFRKGFPSKSGLVLKEDYKQAVIMPDLSSRVNLPASGTYLTALENGLIPIELRNVKKLQLDLWRMYESNIPFVIGEESDNFERDIARRIFTKEMQLDLPLNELVRRSIPVQEMAKGERGLFLLTARDANDGWWNEATQVINLSDMAATARLWEDSILIWVNTLTTARGIQDADVKIFSDKKQLLAQGKTNNAGVFVYELPNNQTWDSDNQPALAIVSKKNDDGHNDLTYVQLSRNLLDREIFDTSGREWLRTGYDAVIFSPRDIYRTGEDVSFKTIVRNADISIPDPFPVLFIVRDTLGRKVKQETLTLSDKGSAIANMKLPSNALTGLWTASVAIPGQEDKPITSYKFHVEDFAPPRLEVNLTTYKKFLLHNDSFAADVYARWLFGVDGAGLNYKTSWSAREGSFAPTQDRWKDYTFGDPSRNFAFTEGTIGEGQLDNFGKLNTSLTLDADWEAPTIINVTLKAEVMEDGGRWVTSTITRPYFPAPWLLGLAPVNDNFVARENARFKVAAITPEEEPADPGELTAELYKVTWDYNIVEIDGRKRWQSTEELNQVSEKQITLKNGVADVSFKPESYGSYMLKISDGEDNARAVYRFYVSSSSSGGGSQLIDRVEVIPEKDSYKVGDKAVINVKVPFEGLLMLNVESSKLITRKIQRVTESEIKFDFPIEANMRPNIWVSAWLIRPVKAEDSKGWASHRAIGLARVKVDISDYNIDVNIDAPDKIEPAGKLPVKLTLKGNSQTLTKNADVSIALVDDGVLGLTHYKTPDLLNYFWGLKKLNSQGFDIYDQIIPVEDQATEQLHPAGDEALAALAGDSNVQRFKILSLFEGTLTPDKNGVITTELDIPEFSGRGRLFVVAASGKNFGKAEKNIQIAREIVTETGMPRFAAPGDSFTVPTTVFNTSGENRNVKITLVPEGLSLKDTFADLNISAGSSAAFNTTAKALGGADKAVLKIVTSWNENGHQREFTQEIEMPVRSAWPVITLGGSGIFENGTTRLELPLNNFMGDINGTLSLADTPAVNLNQAVNFLRNYPYGCLEQTISGAWPFLILPDALAELDPQTLNDESIKSNIDNAIIRIQSMQLYDGSFAMWPGNSTPFNWGSVYAAHFLLNAKNAGINFPEEMFTGVINWMRQYLPSMPAYDTNDDERDDLTTKAYAVYVLTLHGEKPLGWIEYLRENQRRLRPSGHIYLAGAQAIIDGRPDPLRNLQLTSARSSGRTLESDARNTALLLSMWLDVEPRAPEVTELASRLLNLGSNGGWYSTQDNSAALIALARYNVEAAGAKSDITAKLTTETSDSAILTFAHHKTASVKVGELPKDSALLIEANGTGQGCYSWSVTGFPKSQPKPERKNLNIECVYFDEKGNVLNLSQPINHGTIVQVVLTVRPSMTINNLALNYLLPAGFELENPRLDDGETNTGYGVVNDIRDDRLVLFFDRVSGERSYGFKMRAVTRGTFRVPQISAYGMYDSSVRFTGSAQPDIVIK
ncbi:MAG: alpha-2-macroglobulin family protein [Synergistaceae bacterium]|nr:alpha-2-macroglobulin family protein [Synergistaceae bacterium]